MRNFIFALLLLAGCSTVAPPHTAEPVVQPDIAPIVAADRAMAAMAGREGWIEAHTAGASPDAIVLQPGPTPAAGFFAEIPADVRGDTSLTWAPDYAGMARSDDLGFTVGSFNGDESAFGRYLTVWRRHADGWKWIYQDGTDFSERLPLASDVTAIRLAAVGEGASAASALSAAEVDLRRAAAINGGAAYASVLAADARLDRANQRTAIGPADVRTALGDAPITFAEPLMIEPSEAGDLGFVLGPITWDGGHGYYTRIWALTADGWRVVYDQVIERFEPSNAEQ